LTQSASADGGSKSVSVEAEIDINDATPLKTAEKNSSRQIEGQKKSSRSRNLKESTVGHSSWWRQLGLDSICTKSGRVLRIRASDLTVS
jgi:hypothetical protein